jgi:hypothetical protein
MTENLQIDTTDQTGHFDSVTVAATVKITPSSDGKSLIIVLADFVANPGLYAAELEKITTRPVQLQFV